MGVTDLADTSNFDNFDEVSDDDTTGGNSLLSGSRSGTRSAEDEEVGPDFGGNNTWDTREYTSSEDKDWAFANYTFTKFESYTLKQRRNNQLRSGVPMVSSWIK